MISVRAARALVLRTAHPLGTERIPLVAASGRVLTAALRVRFPLPRFTNAAMDGYALRSAETRDASTARAARFRIRRRTLIAGSNTLSSYPHGTTVRIMTGAPMPRGFDAVLPREEARVEDGALVVTRRISPLRFVRVEGEDLRSGGTIAPAGTRVDPGIVALLSACGIAEVDVHSSPRVAIVVTGNEVRRPSSDSPGRHTVFDANSGFLTAALREFDLDPVRVARSRDSASDLEIKLSRALDRADLVLVTGGVSVGERDLVREVLSSLGVKPVFRGVSQQPGKPLYFGRRGEVLVFGLPGNPVSAVVCYCEYVRPCLRRMLGLRENGPEERVAFLDRPLPRLRERTAFIRGRTTFRSGRWSVTPVIPEGSHRFYPFRASDCLIVVPPDSRAPLRRGTRVAIHPFPWRRP